MLDDVAARRVPAGFRSDSTPLNKRPVKILRCSWEVSQGFHIRGPRDSRSLICSDPTVVEHSDPTVVEQKVEMSRNLAGALTDKRDPYT